MMIEDRLRTALRTGAPLALDADAIVRSARRRRVLVRARGGAAVAALLVVAGVTVGLMTQTTDASAPEPGPIGMSPTPAAPAGAQPSGNRGGIQPSSPDIVPGRSLRMFPERWCLVGSSDGREFGCAPLDRHVQRVPDDQGTEWLVMLAPSGPDTAVLQVEQSAAWVNLRSSQVPGSVDRWIGIVPGSEAPEVPRALRALSAQGREIWQP